MNESETVNADVISNSGELEIKVADKLLKIESNEEGEIQTKEIITDINIKYMEAICSWI